MVEGLVSPTPLLAGTRQGLLGAGTATCSQGTSVPGGATAQPTRGLTSASPAARRPGSPHHPLEPHPSPVISIFSQFKRTNISLQLSIAGKRSH